MPLDRAPAPSSSPTGLLPSEKKKQTAQPPLPTHQPTKDIWDADGDGVISTDEAKAGIAAQKQAAAAASSAARSAESAAAREAYEATRATAIPQLLHVWQALGVPTPQMNAYLVRHEVRLDVSSSEEYAKADARLTEAVALWKEAAEAVLAREEALLALMEFEQRAVEPQRLLERQGRPMVTTTPKLNPAPASAEAPAAAPSPSDGPRRKNPAWLLKESRVREGHQARLKEADAVLLELLPRMERAGDAVWFQGELYRQKMRTDVLSMRSALAEAAKHKREKEDRSKAEPFAPRGREMVLTQKEASGVESKQPLRTVEKMPNAKWSKPGTPAGTSVPMKMMTPVRPAHEPPSVLLGKLLTPIERVAPSAAEKNPFLKSEFGRPSTAPFADGSLGPWYQKVHTRRGV